MKGYGLSRLLIMITLIAGIIPNFAVYVIADSYTDMSGEDQGSRLALCHMDTDPDPDIWEQQYFNTNNVICDDSPPKEYWCKKMPNESYKQKCDRTELVQRKIDDSPGSYWGLCTDQVGVDVWCKYDGGDYTTETDPLEDIPQLLLDFPGSHRTSCNGHETHAGDYLGICIDSTPPQDPITGLPVSTYVAPEPSPESLNEKREGPGVGDGHTTGKRSLKPRTRSKSLNRDRQDNQ